jgi:phenylpropionate dioxygenase-like ring-hydroxylating dioxygenase large terminal subunit
MWSRAWVMACRAEDIPEPGDYIVFTDLGVPLLIVRGTDGEIRCFYNTCQHRCAPVVREDRGSSRRLRCQYHSWTYEIDGGKLVALPDERDFVDFDWEARCLPRASCDVFGGFMFVNRDLDATPLASWIGPVAEMFKPFECESLREVYRESVIVPCNWKVAVEAFLEVYHFKHIHSHNGVSILDNRGAAMGLYQNGHSRMITPVLRTEPATRRYDVMGRLEARRPRSVPVHRRRTGDGRLQQHLRQPVPEHHHPARMVRVPDQLVLADRQEHNTAGLDLLRTR